MFSERIEIVLIITYSMPWSSPDGVNDTIYVIGSSLTFLQKSNRWKWWISSCSWMDNKLYKSFFCLNLLNILLKVLLVLII